ncbi:MAG: thioesterase family protein [Acetobacteraceae bacterium]
MTSLDKRPVPGPRAAYRRFLPISLRWMDNDVFGHVNNAHYYSLFDIAVCEFLVGSGILTWRGSDHFMVVAESGCRYHAEVAFPDRVTAGLRVVRLGTSSVRYDIGIFRDDDATASAEGFMVHVCVAAATRRPAPLPASWRTALQTLTLGE